MKIQPVPYQGSSFEAYLAYKSSGHLLPLLVKSHHDKTVGIPLLKPHKVQIRFLAWKLINIILPYTSKPFEVPSAANFTFHMTFWGCWMAAAGRREMSTLSWPFPTVCYHHVYHWVTNPLLRQFYVIQGTRLENWWRKECRNDGHCNPD